MTTRAELRADHRPRRPLLRSFRFWIPVGIVLVLLILATVGALVGKPVYDRAMSAKSSLEQAMPLASTAKTQILAGDSEGAKATATQLSALTADAREQTDDEMWKSLEWVPFVGDNLHAVRTAAAVTDNLVQDALGPATGISLDFLKPVNGAINLAAVANIAPLVQQAKTAVNHAVQELNALDRGALIPQVETAVAQLESATEELQPVLGSASEVLGVLPSVLGANEPRHYLMIFQNNAESRGTGGNPAALVMIDVDQGRISLGQQATSANFSNGRQDPVLALNPETEALYGDKIGRWISDATLSPDFPESADIVRAWWAEEYGTPVDGVLSFDPIALGYLLTATGPATVPTDPVDVNGHTIQVLDEPLILNAENAAPFLLNQVYSQYPDVNMQDAIFAASAKSIFDLVASGIASPTALFSALTKAVDEGRLMYAPTREDEARLLYESRLSGKLPSTNHDSTVVAAYVNDVTQSKLDYYLQLDLAVASTQCSNPDEPTFTLSATLTNTVTPAEAPNLPYHIAPARYFDKGLIATDLVMYGPVGANAAQVTLDGKPHDATVVMHLGRPAVKVPIRNAPGQTHTVAVEFLGSSEAYGTVEVRHTPMVRPTPIDLEGANCG